MNAKPKKVALFIGSDITAHLVLNKIVPEMIDNGFRPVIFLPEHKSSLKADHPELKKLAFFERTLLKEVVYPYLNGLTERPNPIAPAMLAKKYEKYGVKCIEVADINHPEFIKRQRKARGYVGALSVRCFQIFKPEHIEVWREKGFLLNLHPGLLPEYRGVLSVARAMANEKEKNYGWTLHHIDAGIDTGNTLGGKPRLSIDRSKSALRLTIEMADSGARAITRVFEDMRYDQIIEGDKQPPVGEGAKYYTYPNHEELKQWDKANIALVHPEEIPLLYASIFSDETSTHGKGLKNILRQAIDRAGFSSSISDNMRQSGRTAINPMSSLLPAYSPPRL